MNGFQFTKLLSLVALTFALPAWAIAPSEQAKTNATGSDQGNQAVTSEAPASTPGDKDVKSQDKDAATKQRAHGPTATMDRATPVEKSGKGDRSAKHPPTARMDRTTPDQKSPASTASGNDEQTPSSAK